MSSRFPFRACAFALAGAVAFATACGDGSVPSSFDRMTPSGPPAPTAVDAGRLPDDGLIDDVTPSEMSDPTLGGPCVDDAQCDDGIECTFDRCDAELERCRFVPDDAFCQDDRYCNGVEVCSPTRGCRPGEVVTCSDDTACTIDRCVEAERSCVHEPRDADADGDVDAHCGEEATDCDDRDPFVSGLVEEICGNGKDDDCDLAVDEPDCQSPAHDDCGDARPVTASETLVMSLAAASPDAGSACGFDGAVDVFLDLVVEEGPYDVLVTASAALGRVGLAATADCGDASAEVACHASSEEPTGPVVSRLLLRALEDGRHSVAVLADVGGDVEVRVDYRPASADPGAETCGQAGALVPGEPFVVDLFGASPDEVTSCGAGGDRVFAFDVDEPSDVHAFASAQSGGTEPSLSLRGPDCAEERSCVAADPAELFARGLEPGRYWLSVSAQLPDRVDVVLEVVPETPAPAGDDCDEPPVLPHGRVLDLALADFADDVSLGCLEGARDAVLRLEIDEPSDVLLLHRLSQRDRGAIGLVPKGACRPADALGCTASDRSPLRLVEHRLLPGAYDVVVESALGASAQVLAFVRPATPPTLATSAEDCETLIDIPRGGGSFQGNTASAIADFSASCDVGGISENGAADQMLRFELTEARRVFLDMEGSTYGTLLDLRRGDGCPGEEVACASTFDGPRSYLDLVLDAGTYFVQVDGYAGAEGQWFLEVFTTEP